MDSDRLLQTFLDLARISSPSHHEGEVVRYLTSLLEEVGCNVRIDGSAKATGSDTGNLIATLEGDQPGRIFMTAHMDTVSPCDNITPIVEDGVIRSDGSTVLGADDKVGIAAAVETVRSLAEQGTDHPTVVCLFTTCEEVGLLGASNIDADLFKGGELTLVLDGDAAPGTVTIATAHQYRFDLAFSGRAAHAGVAPEKGINAIEMAAAAISGMELGRIDETTTANVAFIEGGGVTNIVPETCKVTGECRALSMQRLDEVRDAIEAAASLAAEAFQGEFSSVWTKTVEGFDYPDDDPFVRLVLDAAREAGLPARTDVSCGATDGNCYAAYQARPVVLGTGMCDFHSKTEHLSIADLEGTTRHLLFVCRMYSER